MESAAPPDEHQRGTRTQRPCHIPQPPLHLLGATTFLPPRPQITFNRHQHKKGARPALTTGLKLGLDLADRQLLAGLEDAERVEGGATDTTVILTGAGWLVPTGSRAALTPRKCAVTGPTYVAGRRAAPCCGACWCERCASASGRRPARPPPI
jgi:hypothetical protein